MTKRRSLFVLALVIAMGVLPLVAQQQQADRVKAIGGKFLCMCGCSQVLTQCNHVGCTMSAGMLKELGQWVNRGDSEATITQAFVQQFGTTVYAEPPKTGFSLIAWAMPVIYFVAGAVAQTASGRGRGRGCSRYRCGRQNFPGSHGTRAGASGPGDRGLK